MKCQSFPYMILLFFLLLLFLNGSPVSVYAEPAFNTEPDGVTITGTYGDSIEIKTDNNHFFHASIMNPGDQWESWILMKNGGRKKIKLRLKSIVNRLEDDRMLDVLKLRIRTDTGRLIYDGSYKETPSPVMDWISFSAGEELLLSVHTEFPAECGNAYQAARFDTVWIFEAENEENSNPQQSQDPPRQNLPPSIASLDPQIISSPVPDQNLFTQSVPVATGDPSPILLYLIGISASLLFFLLILFRKKMGKGVLLFLSFLLLTGSSLAIFSDHVSLSFHAAAGNLELSIEEPETGKRYLAYDQENIFHIRAENKGNKSMDMKILLNVTSNLPLQEGFSCGNETLPCFRLFSVENPRYQYTFEPGSTPVFLESVSPAPLSGIAQTDPDQPGLSSVTFEFRDLLNGSHPTKDNEVESGGKEELDLPVCLFFPSYQELPGWELLTRNAFYRITVTIYGKQHRNTSDTDWEILFRNWK